MNRADAYALVKSCRCSPLSPPARRCTMLTSLLLLQYSDDNLSFIT
jgi:hypothetical protein